jgi:hypothetical protein
MALIYKNGEKELLAGRDAKGPFLLLPTSFLKLYKGYCEGRAPAGTNLFDEYLKTTGLCNGLSYHSAHGEETSHLSIDISLVQEVDDDFFKDYFFNGGRGGAARLTESS